MSKYIIEYLERFAGIKEIPATAWIRETTQEEWIPQHRIKYFKHLNENGQQEVVWDRENRIDKIFKSDSRNDLTEANADLDADGVRCDSRSSPDPSSVEQSL